MAKNVVATHKCVGCAACVVVCPFGCLQYVDGQPVLNEWHSASDEVYTVDVPLDGARRLTVEYFEGGGEARVRLWWKRTGDM